MCPGVQADSADGVGRPSRPLRLFPHVKHSPMSVRATVWAAPHETDLNVMAGDRSRMGM